MSSARVAKWMASYLDDLQSNLPPPHWRAEPVYDATSMALDDLARDALLAAHESPDAIWLAVCARAKTGRWPRMRRNVVYWTAARIYQAQRHALEVIGRASVSASQLEPLRPTDVQAATKRLLLDYWRDVSADRYVRDNLRHWIFVDRAEYPDGDPELECWLERWEARPLPLSL